MEWIELGYLGLFIATFLAATIIPFSSEAILSAMLLAGYEPVACVIVATAGNTAGGMTGYAIGYVANWRAIAKYLRSDESQVLRWQNLVGKYGAYAAILCWMPFIGDVIAIALGLFKAGWIRVLFWMTTGKFLRYLAMASILQQIID